MFILAAVAVAVNTGVVGRLPSMRDLLVAPTADRGGQVLAPKRFATMPAVYSDDSCGTPMTGLNTWTSTKGAIWVAGSELEFDYFGLCSDAGSKGSFNLSYDMSKCGTNKMMQLTHYTGAGCAGAGTSYTLDLFDTCVPVVGVGSFKFMKGDFTVAELCTVIRYFNSMKMYGLKQDLWIGNQCNGKPAHTQFINDTGSSDNSSDDECPEEGSCSCCPDRNKANACKKTGNYTKETFGCKDGVPTMFLGRYTDDKCTQEAPTTLRIVFGECTYMREHNVSSVQTLLFDASYYCDFVALAIKHGLWDNNVSAAGHVVAPLVLAIVAAAAMLM